MIGLCEVQTHSQKTQMSEMVIYLRLKQGAVDTAASWPWNRDICFGHESHDNECTICGVGTREDMRERQKREGIMGLPGGLKLLVWGSLAFMLYLSAFVFSCVLKVLLSTTDVSHQNRLISYPAFQSVDFSSTVWQDVLNRYHFTIRRISVSCLNSHVTEKNCHTAFSWSGI